MGNKMGYSHQSTLAYHKRNCLWPLRAVGSGWITATLLARFDAAVYHFVRAQKGSIYYDPEYGTDLYKLRTQTITDEEVQIQRASMVGGFSRWLPDLLLVSLELSKDSENEELEVAITWKIRAAIDTLHGNLAKPQKTTVVI